jgi:cytochrome c oxidase accessory protein FixG
MPAGKSVAPPAPGRVLSTLNADGTRRWLTPKLSRGRFHSRRRVMAWALIALFTAIPYIRISGRPMILLDVTRREFTLLGTTFLPTETVLLALLLVGIFLSIFIATALFGRVWCGWACPQTVYMEFVFRPLERLVKHPGIRHAVFVLVSMFLAHTFLAYFVGVERLAHWVTGSPFAHPAAFLVMAATTLLMLLDFGWFREQVCLVACPYGRFQSVLLDRRSLIVGYDPRRGEPRGTFRRGVAARASAAGADCVDCRLCVRTCPTGIDIRDGLQMECIHCAQCIDACDAVMAKIGRPLGLIRYTSRAELGGEARRWLRPRLVFYPALLLLVFGAFTIALLQRAPADVTVLRAQGSPFTLLPSNQVSNQIRIKIVNRTREDRRYHVAIADNEALHLVAPENPIAVAAGKTGTAVVFVTAPRAALPGGRLDIRFRVSDGAGFTTLATYRLLGPAETATSGAAAGRS